VDGPPGPALRKSWSCSAWPGSWRPLRRLSRDHQAEGFAGFRSGQNRRLRNQRPPGKQRETAPGPADPVRAQPAVPRSQRPEQLEPCCSADGGQRPARPIALDTEPLPGIPSRRSWWEWGLLLGEAPAESALTIPIAHQFGKHCLLEQAPVATRQLPLDGGASRPWPGWRVAQHTKTLQKRQVRTG